MFTDSEKTDIRRFCGYPARGATQTGGQTCGFYQASGLLEFRINNLSDAEYMVTRRYLASLIVLEQAVPHAGDNLDTDQAAVWIRNRDELRDRTALFDDWRRRLCGFLGIVPGPAMAATGLTLVV
jgi:hypothetical protein